MQMHAQAQTVGDTDTDAVRRICIDQPSHRADEIHASTRYRADGQHEISLLRHSPLRIRTKLCHPCM
jgi:hypothetical protein